MWKSCSELNQLSFPNDESSSSSIARRVLVIDNSSKKMLNVHHHNKLHHPTSSLETTTTSSPLEAMTNNNENIVKKKYQLALSFNSSSASSGSNKKRSTNNNNPIDFKTIKSPWDILCKLINCKVAFMKQFDDKKYNWFQLAGHPGRFKPGERQGYILKLMDDSERNCFYKLRNDVLFDYVPKIDNLIIDTEDRKVYTEMQDLLCGFNNPCIMDIKIGVRTFLENEYMSENELKPREDLYMRMIEVSPEEPNERENAAKAVTKRRYMTWRETSTSSSTLGFRIEAIKKNHVVNDKDLYKVKEVGEVKKHFQKFAGNKETSRKYIQRLNALYANLTQSSFFSRHEIIGSSLLFVHDTTKANIWMIDFGKTRELPAEIEITHARPWIDGNHEDGYLLGIKSLIEIFQSIIIDEKSC